MSLMPFDASILDGQYELDTGAVAAVVTASGNYSGNSTTNRAIPHGLGVEPKTVLIMCTIFGGLIVIMDPGKTHHQNPTAEHIQSVTTVDSTNFYVGNAADYPYTGNSTGANYYWVAIA